MGKLNVSMVAGMAPMEASVTINQYKDIVTQPILSSVKTFWSFLGGLLLDDIASTHWLIERLDEYESNVNYMLQPLQSIEIYL